ncbi:hypothetical protein L9F63_005174, partial [Diploptera punctata]
VDNNILNFGNNWNKLKQCFLYCTFLNQIAKKLVLSALNSIRLQLFFFTAMRILDFYPAYFLPESSEDDILDAGYQFV